MDFNLERFIEAQDTDNSLACAIKELEQGEKISHWMWYVFPQIKGLGHSPMAKKYAISSLYEAYAFINNAKNRDRLYEVTRIMNELNDDRDIEDVLGQIDAMKFKSCMTLFDIVEPNSEFDRALEIFFNGKRDQKTLEILADEITEFRFNPYRDYGYIQPVKALFDGGSHEGERLGAEVRLATLLDFKRRGCSIAIMSRNYLISRNDLFDHYRTTNLEHTLSCLGVNFIDEIIEWCYKTDNMAKGVQVANMFPDTYFDLEEYSDWETFAFRLDLLFGFCIEDRILSMLVNDIINTHSALK